MTQNVQANKLYTAILIVAIASLCQAVFGSTVVSFLTGRFITILVRWIIPLVVILGYAMFLVGLGKWTIDESAKKNLQVGTILAIIGVALAWLHIPFIGWVTKILFIIAFVMMMLGYAKVPGGSMARVASIVLMAAAIVSLIPFLSIVTPFVYIVAWILLIVGWAKIKKA